MNDLTVTIIGESIRRGLAVSHFRSRDQLTGCVISPASGAASAAIGIVSAGSHLPVIIVVPAITAVVGEGGGVGLISVKRVLATAAVHVVESVVTVVAGERSRRVVVWHWPHARNAR